MSHHVKRSPARPPTTMRSTKRKATSRTIVSAIPQETRTPPSAARTIAAEAGEKSTTKTTPHSAQPATESKKNARS